MNTAKIDKSYLELIRVFPLVPIRTNSERKGAVKVMKELAYRLDDLNKGEKDYLEVLSDLILKYESKLPSLGKKISARRALTYLMEINGLAQADLVEYVGHKSNLSAFLSGKRGLSKKAACKLGERFKVSPEVFFDD